MSVLSIEDPNVRNYVTALEKRLAELERRTDLALSPEGTIVAHLAADTKKSTTTGDKKITSGAVDELDSLDDVPDGTTYGKVLDADLDANQVKQIRDTVGARNVTGDQVYDKGNDSFDDVSDGSTYIRVTSVSVGNQVQAGSIATDAVEEAKILDGAVATDKLADDAVTNDKIGLLAVDTTELAADAVDGTKLADVAVDTEHVAVNAIGGAHFDELVVEEFQSVDMGSGLNDSQWDALET